MSTNRNIGGMYQLACEASPNKNQIDTWLNEGKSNQWISNQLKEMDDYISVNSISKYKKYRENLIKQELEKMPEFQAKQMEVQNKLNESVAKVQTVDLIGRLGAVIEDSAELLEQAKYDDIRINNVKDLRMVQQTMIDAVKVYGETMLNAQKFQEINRNPDILQNKTTTININIKNALSDILKTAIEDDDSGFNIIDKLRGGISHG